MRDANRMKEKFDLSLDNRQIVSLLIGGIVVLGSVFVLGVVVGKKLAESGRAETAPNLLATLDEKAATMEKVKKEPELTFERELTRPGNSVVTLPKPQPPAKEPAKVEAAAPAPEKPAEVAAEKPSAEPAPEAAQPAEPPKVAAVEPKPEVKKPEPKKVEPAVAKVAPKVEPAAAHPAAKAEPAGQGGFTLQLSASPSRAEADKFAQGVKAKGYAPYIVEAAVPGKGTYYRVRLGRFPSKEAAQKYLADFKRETQLPAFIAAN